MPTATLRRPIPAGAAAMTQDNSDLSADAAAEWARRCLARMLALDPSADATLLAPIVTQMSSSASWRARTPEAAAEWCFGPLKASPSEGSDEV
jgi:hypothetical protein